MSHGHCHEATFSSTTPHFFKIILDETLREERLLIPKKFSRLYGQGLSNSVSIKLPCGSKWKMEVTKLGGQVWLDKGWTEFAQHYFIVRGHMLCFRYQGNSEFEAVIFDSSTVEIDYPFVTRHSDERDIEYKRKARESDFVENSDDSQICPNKYQSPCSRPQKRRRIEPVTEPEIKFSRPNKTVLQNSEGKGDSPSSESEKKGQQDLTLSEKISPTVRCTKPLDRGEKAAAFEKASCFTSDRPFFKVVMQPYYVHGHTLNFPLSFAKAYLRGKSPNAILKVRNETSKAWPVKQFFEFGTKKPKAGMSSGWREFARGNSLEIGDVCVFVLLKSATVSYEVAILRANSSENKTNTPSSCHGLGVKQECLDSDAIKKQQAFSPIEKSRLLEKAHFVSGKPLFKVVVQPSYTSGVSRMPIPKDVMKRFFKNEGNIILRVTNRGSWPVRVHFLRSNTGRLLCEFSGGWRAFTEGNNLKAGDVCIFELVDGTETVFEVSIVRIAEDDAYHK